MTDPEIKVIKLSPRDAYKYSFRPHNGVLASFYMVIRMYIFPKRFFG